jgi:5-methylcytosine-specific restriction endonuclease McrA
MTEESEFDRVTGERYNAMRQRFAETRKNWLGQELPFTLPQYRVWFASKLNPDGTGRCFYCNAPVNLSTAQTEHKMPPWRPHGSLDLANLVVSCPKCNQQKGAMSAAAFQRLREVLFNEPVFHEIDRVSVLSRLESQLKLVKLANLKLKRRANGNPKIR